MASCSSFFLSSPQSYLSDAGAQALKFPQCTPAGAIKRFAQSCNADLLTGKHSDTPLIEPSKNKGHEIKVVFKQ